MAKGKKKLSTSGLRKLGGYSGPRYSKAAHKAGKRGGKHKQSAASKFLAAVKIW